jgi:hypothetical protein
MAHDADTREMASTRLASAMQRAAPRLPQILLLFHRIFFRLLSSVLYLYTSATSFSIFPTRATESLISSLLSDMAPSPITGRLSPANTSIASTDRSKLITTSDNTSDEVDSSHEEVHISSLVNIAHVPSTNTVAFPTVPTTPTAAVQFPPAIANLQKETGTEPNSIKPRQYSGKVFDRSSHIRVERHGHGRAIDTSPGSTISLFKAHGPPISFGNSDILVNQSGLRARTKPHWRTITPRDTPLCSPATEPTSYFSSGSSTSSGRLVLSRQSSWTSDRLSFRQRVALKLATQRDLCDQQRTTEQTGPHVVLKNGNECYALSGMIGRGGYGRVMRAYSNEGDEVAIKVIHKAMAYRYSYGRDRIIHELNALKRVTEVDLPFVCPLLCSWSDEKNVYMVMVSSGFP